MKLSRGVGGNLDPPAFQRAKRERMTKSLSQGCGNESSDLAKLCNSACASQKEELCVSEPESIGVDVEHMTTKDGEYGESHREDDMHATTHDESESLSDIDDREVNVYIQSEEERHYKKIIWEKLNWDYLKEQAAAKEAFEGLQATRKRDRYAAASVAKSQKGKKQRQTPEAKSSGVALSAAVATHEMSRKKRLCSKVNFDMVEKLFDEPAALENPKKARFEPWSDNHDNLDSELENKNKGDLESVDEFEEDIDDMGGLYESTLYGENVDERYDYEDDDYSYE